MKYHAAVEKFGEIKGEFNTILILLPILTA